MLKNGSKQILTEEVYTWNKPTLTSGQMPFLIGCTIKLALVALLIPSIWKLINSTKR
jgi:biotin transport system substrate-specific component